MTQRNRNIGQLVRELRRERGLSLDALAYAANISPRTLALVERYGYPPKTRAARERLANALGVPVSELFPETEGVVQP